MERLNLAAVRGKKVIACLMAFVLAFTLFGTGAEPAFADDSAGALAAGVVELGNAEDSVDSGDAINDVEIESDSLPFIWSEGARALATRATSNNSPSNAMGISVNQLYYGSLSSSSDEKWYKFTLTQPGWVSLTFDKDYLYNGTGGWLVDLYQNDASTRFTGWRFWLDHMGAETTGSIGLPAGSYYVKVDVNSWNHTDRSYNLKVNCGASGVWDREPANDSPQTAQAISLGTTYYGTTYASDDEDWYSFTLSQPGWVSLTFDKDYLYNGTGGWLVDLYQNDASTRFTGWRFWLDHMGAETTGSIGLPAGSYYVKVDVNSWNHTDRSYNLKVNCGASGVWDREPANDSPQTAQVVGLNTTYYGTTYKSGDEDWYRFYVPKAGRVYLSFGKEYSIEGDGWDVAFYDATLRNRISDFSCPKPNDKKTNLYNAKLAKGTYYLRIAVRSSGIIGLGYGVTESPYYFTLMQGKHLSKASVTAKNATYKGKAAKPSVSVKYSGKRLKKNRDYTVSYSNNTKAGTGKATIKGKGKYCGTKTVKFKIARGPQPMSVKGKTKTVSRAALKSQSVTVANAVVLKKAQGKVVFKNLSTGKAKKFKVNSKTGDIKVPKNMKRGTYKIKMKVTAKGNGNYKSGSKTVTVKIKVK